MTDQARYLKALHAMQAGVAFCRDKSDQTPKHLRVGVNSAMCDTAALAKLLIAKGVITWDEFYKAIADEAELEVERYKDRIEKEIGVRPQLG